MSNDEEKAKLNEIRERNFIQATFPPWDGEQSNEITNELDSNSQVIRSKNRVKMVVGLR